MSETFYFQELLMSVMNCLEFNYFLKIIYIFFFVFRILSQASANLFIAATCKCIINKLIKTNSIPI